MNRLTEILFKKQLDECSAEEITNLTHKYPYFNAGHLLALKKTGPAADEKQKNVLQSANLHFHPAFLSSILYVSGEAKIIQSELNQAKEPGNQQPITGNPQPPNSTEQLTFEPFHTVDYFASQGIKVKPDENPTDKFSKQLKSFTEWLKTMKKIPAITESAPAEKETTEVKVEQLAEKSIADSNVITEAMAEVWIKQGNPEKAIEIYHKLSLLEPPKSPYFATRISDLKKN